jgi:hypothetical protein
MFFPGSRYAAQIQYTFTAADGSVLQCVKPPTPGLAATLGFHRRSGSERLDHMAARYLANATQFWRLSDASGAISPDALAARDLVGVPLDAQQAG